ncbi:MAG: T9SS type A sorting domain-containing protein [Bacteroidia bacterium]|nr:T9SS type A sorting domain-containing protein [Bacteroidia bacterium]
MKILVIFFPLVLLAAIHLQCQAQITYTTNWGCSFGSTLNESPSNITVDSKGSIYIIGTFVDTMDFTCAQPTQLLNGSPNGFNESGFIVKYDSSGNFKWAQNIGYNSILTITSDASDNIYIFGNGCPRFNTINGPILLCDLGQVMFFAKLDTNGTCLWARALNAGSYPSDDDGHGWSITADTNQNVYITGDFRGTIDFDPSYPNTFFLTSTQPFSDAVFVAKYNSSGLLEWAINTTSDDNVFNSKIASDNNGNVYLIGRFSGIMDINPGVDTFLITASCSNGAFIAKFNTLGQLTWAHPVNNKAWAEIISVGIDISDKIWISGFFTDSIALDFNNSNNYLTPIGSRNAFVAKYNNDGTNIWVKQYVGSGNTNPASMFLDDNSNSFIYMSNGQILQYNSSGSITDSISLQGTNNTIYAKPYKMNNLFLCGSFVNNITLPSDSGDISLVSKGGKDVFVSKLSINNVGIPEYNIQPITIGIFPNPAFESLSIKFDSNKMLKGNIEIYSVTGKILICKKFNNMSETNPIVNLNIEQLNCGMYFCKVFTDEKVFVKSFIKQKQ